MSRNRKADAQAAAQAASEAGRILQAQGQAKAQDSLALDPPTEVRQAPKLDDTRERMMEGIYEGRRKAAQKITDPSDMPPGLPPEESQPSEEERAEAEAVKKAEKAREAAVLKVQKADEQKKKDANAAVQQTEQAAQEPAAAEEPTAPTTSKQKVDGVEYDVPLTEIEEMGGEKAWRLNKASENRLAKAAEALAEAKRETAKLAAWAQAQQNPPKPQQTDEQFIASKMQAIRFGTDEESAAAMREVLERGRPQIDRNALVLEATATMKRDLALSEYRSKFSDILANPVLKTAADQMEREELAKFVNGQQIDWNGLLQLDWNKFYTTIGTKVASVVGPRPSQPTTTQAAAASGTPSQLSEKEARKASIVNIPTAAAARAATPSEEKPETREEAFNRMRKARGLPTG